ILSLGASLFSPVRPPQEFAPSIFAVGGGLDCELRLEHLRSPIFSSGLFSASHSGMGTIGWCVVGPVTSQLADRNAPSQGFGGSHWTLTHRDSLLSLRQ